MCAVDARLFEAINDLAGRIDGIDDVVEVITRFAPFALVAMLIGLWFWPGSRQERDDRQWSVIVATVAASLALGLNQLIIRLWARPRPFISHHDHLLVSRSHDPSFPSDHATFAFAVAVAIFLGSRRVGIVALVLAVVLGCSRVYVGAHYPGDVLVGAVIGGGMAVAIDQLRTWAHPLLDPPLRLAQRLRLG
jgi:undecaprenyl-diphosphatase